jgi:predicted nucleic acid-binding protein
LNRPAAFWDSSALVPLCVGQSATSSVQALYKRYRAVVWWGTPIEIASALARLLRMQLLNAEQWARSRQLALEFTDEWSTIQPVATIRSQAIDLVNRYDLHAADSLQLSAAMTWSACAAQGHTFLTLDQKLRDAALLSGFDAPRI